MRTYQHLLQQCYLGDEKTDRTGTGTTSIFGPQMRFDLSKGFPLLTTKKIHWKSVVGELLWLLSGATNIQPLVKQGIGIWTDWPLAAYNKLHPGGVTMEWFTRRIATDEQFAKSWGDLGPVYGKQWRNWGSKPDREHSGTDQIAQMIALLKGDPNSRRMVVSAWNVDDLPAMSLSPCHCLFQFYVAQGKLSCQLYQRSGDVFLGVPFNIASYALLTLMMAQVTGFAPGEFIWTGGDVHLYKNHRAQAEEQLGRVPRALPTVKLNPAVDDLFAFTAADITLEGYDPWPAIKAEVAV